MDFKVTVEKKEAGYFIISAAGSIDTDTYEEFEKKISSVLDSLTKKILLNMENVDYVSSVAFGVIFRTKQTLEKNGGTLAIANLQPQVKKIFDAVKAIPEALFANLREADEYLDSYIALISRKNKDA